MKNPAALESWANPNVISNSGVVFDGNHSSLYLQQPATDLVIRARFGSSRATKLIPIAIGLCLFEEPIERRRHAVRIDKPPMAGVPFLQLCPE
jgi:hypothetical protein